MAGNVQNIQIKPVNASWGGSDLGYLDGDVNIKISEELESITTHQTGKMEIGNIRVGIKGEVTLALKESDVIRLKQIISASGSTFTPTGGTPTALTGWGTAKIGTGTYADSKRLVLRGVNDTDGSKDFTFWKAYPQISDIKFSGDKFQTIPIVFKIYPDAGIDGTISLGAIGDSSQTAFVGL